MIVTFPMTGPNKFKDNQYLYPKPLIEINGHTMFENAVSLYRDISDVRFISIVNRQDVNDFHIDQVVNRATEGYESDVCIVSGQTAGALCSTLLVSDSFDEEELIISNYDHHVSFDFSAALEFFRNNNSDFGVISFDSAHPRWSYVKLDIDGSVIQSAEKNPISRHALAGIYYFKDASQFTAAAKDVVLSAGSDKKIFFISETLNSYILCGMKGSCYLIDRDQYHNFYDASEVNEFIVKKNKRSKIDQIRLKTEKYVKDFDEKNLDSVVSMFDENAIINDPEIGEIVGKNAIRSFLFELFTATECLIFQKKKVIVEGETSVIEFVLGLDSKKFHGSDIIQWSAGKITRIDAFLEEK